MCAFLLMFESKQTYNYLCMIWKICIISFVYSVHPVVQRNEKEIHKYVWLCTFNVCRNNSIQHMTKQINGIKSAYHLILILDSNSVKIKRCRKYFWSPFFTAACLVPFITYSIVRIGLKLRLKKNLQRKKPAALYALQAIHLACEEICFI